MTTTQLTTMSDRRQRPTNGAATKHDNLSVPNKSLS